MEQSQDINTIEELKEKEVEYKSPRIIIQKGLVAEEINYARDWADRMGVTEDIERLSYDRKTAREVRNELDNEKKLDLVKKVALANGENPRRESEDFIRRVRVTLDIPSMDDYKEFEEARNKYLIRKQNLKERGQENERLDEKIEFRSIDQDKEIIGNSLINPKEFVDSQIDKNASKIDQVEVQQQIKEFRKIADNSDKAYPHPLPFEQLSNSKTVDQLYDKVVYGEESKSKDKSQKEAELNKETQKSEELANEKKEQLLKLLRNEYKIVKDKYYEKDNGQLAFRDNDKKLMTSRNDEHIAFSMVNLAQAKGWEAIKISGNAEFRRSIWMEAGLRDIKVRGYTPSKEDIRELEEKREERTIRSLKNSIEHDESREKKISNNRDASDQKQDIQKRNSSYETETEQKTDTKRWRGKLLEHGAAPYKYDKKNEENYYVKIENKKGTKTLWGIDFERAINESGVKQGDQITLEFAGKRMVTIPKRDKDGEIVGKIDVERNSWNVEKVDRSKMVEAAGRMAMEKKGISVDSSVGKSVLNGIQQKLSEREKSGRVPEVPWYDINAPKQEHTHVQNEPEQKHDRERAR